VRAIQEGLAIQPLNVFGAGLEEKEYRRYATATSIIQVLLAILSAVIVATVGWVLTATGNDVAGPTLFSLWLLSYGGRCRNICGVCSIRAERSSTRGDTLLANGVRLVLMFYWASQGTLTGIGGLTAIAWVPWWPASLVFVYPPFLDMGYLGLRETWKRNWNFGRWQWEAQSLTGCGRILPCANRRSGQLCGSGRVPCPAESGGTGSPAAARHGYILTPHTANLYEQNGRRA